MATGTMNRASSPYSGPGSNYAYLIGTISNNKSVDVLWKEGSYYYIEVDMSAGKMCCYVPTSAVTVSGSVTTHTPPDDKIRYPNTDITEAYLGDNSSYQQTEPPQFPLEVKYLGKKVGDYAFLDYKIPGENKRRRAWVEHMKMRETPRTPGDYTSNHPINADGDSWYLGTSWNGDTTDSGSFGHLANDIQRFRGLDKLWNKDIYAIAAGTVVAAGDGGANGNIMVIEHSYNNKAYYSYYAHMKSFYVSVGDEVYKDQAIGIMGDTGYVEIEHVHLAITRNNLGTGVAGYVKDENGTKIRFDSLHETLGYYDYRNTRFFNPQKYFAEGPSFITDNYNN